jgi:hypothetical protein
MYDGGSGSPLMKEGSAANEKQRRASVDKDSGGDGAPVTGYATIFTFVCDHGHRCLLDQLL